MTKFYIKVKKKFRRNLFERIIISNFFFQRTYYFFKYLFYSNQTLIDFKLSKKNDDLVIGAVYGMAPNSISIFLTSLRKFYRGDIILIGIKNDKEKFFELCKKYKCNFIIDNNNPLNGFINRYKIYAKIFDKFKFKKNILLADTRDVFFQNNPFNKIKKDKIYIGAEKNIFYRDTINSGWVEKFYNFETLYKLKNKQVLCSGVIIGPVSKLKKFVKLLINEHKKVLNKFDYSTLSFPRGSDNTTVNYCYYFLCNKEDFIITNSLSEKISTLAALRTEEIKYKDNKFLSFDNKFISIVHQYDRYFKIEEKK